MICPLRANTTPLGGCISNPLSEITGRAKGEKQTSKHSSLAASRIRSQGLDSFGFVKMAMLTS